MTMEMESIQQEKRGKKGKWNGAKGRHEERRYVWKKRVKVEQDQPKRRTKKGGNGNEAKGRHEKIKEQNRKKNIMYGVWIMIYCRIPFIVVLKALPCCSPLSKLFASVVGGIVGML